MLTLQELKQDRKTFTIGLSGYTSLNKWVEGGMKQTQREHAISTETTRTVKLIDNLFTVRCQF